jgi:hypothetical protein
MNWRRGLIRLWLVGSVFLAVPVGWLTWPGDAPQEYARYWYYRVAHSEVIDERRTNNAAVARQRAEAVSEIRGCYDRWRVAHAAPTMSGLPDLQPAAPGQAVTMPEGVLVDRL